MRDGPPPAAAPGALASPRGRAPQLKWLLSVFQRNAPQPPRGSSSSAGGGAEPAEEEDASELVDARRRMRFARGTCVPRPTWRASLGANAKSRILTSSERRLGGGVGGGAGTGVVGSVARARGEDEEACGSCVGVICGTRDWRRDLALEERRDSAAEARRETAGLGGAGREEVRESRWEAEMGDRFGGVLGTVSGMVMVGVEGGLLLWF